MKRVLLYFSMLLAIGLLSACSNTDDDPDVPEGWSKGPKGFFELKITNETTSDIGDVMLEAFIESSPNNMSDVEKWLLCQGRKIHFRAEDIPVNDRNVGNKVKAKITSYYQVPTPYWNIIIICQIKKINLV